jgi:hypothetical protein
VFCRFAEGNNIAFLPPKIFANQNQLGTKFVFQFIGFLLV